MTAPQVAAAAPSRPPGTGTASTTDATATATAPAPSQVSGIVWPALAGPLPDGLLALCQQLDSSQWLSRQELEAGQRRQLAVLLVHAEAHSAHFRQRLRDAGLSVAALLAPGGLAALAPLPRRALQSQRHDIAARQFPAAHRPTGEVSTSGSTGTPVVATRTAITHMFWLAFTLREHLWHHRDPGLALAITRANLGQHAGSAVAGTAARSFPDWGAPVAALFPTGPAQAMPINRPPAEQLAWLRVFNPGYLLTYPTNLAALLDEVEAQGASLPNLRQVRTIGETLAPGLRRRTRAVLGVDIADTYSSQELGTLALQCPVSGSYHTMAEGYVIEVLDRHGAPCRDGETGRVVVTDLHNFATPLIRYDVGDYAEVGPACPCGRGLPTLRRLVGRERNMVQVRGQRHWPLLGFQQFRDVAPIVQYQLVQSTPERINFWFVSAAPLSETQRQQLAAIVQQALGHPFEIVFHACEGSIPLPASGKFEEFVCMLE